jgi:hypothetical protein
LLEYINALLLRVTINAALTWLDVTVHNASGVQVLDDTDEGVQHHLHSHALTQAATILLEQGKQIAAIAKLLDHDHMVALLQSAAWYTARNGEKRTVKVRLFT